MTFVDINRRYEAWLRTACRVDEEDLARKHERMTKSPFVFLRATFFRWAYTITKAAPDALSAPAVLCLGDAHLENFGTWRDAEGRLVWGFNDFDDVAAIPYTSDLLRLAVSVRLAGVLDVGAHDASEALLTGYVSGLQEPNPTLLDEKEIWMRDYVACSDDDRLAFWAEVDACADADPPHEAEAAMRRHLPAGAEVERFAKRRKGGGGLGRPRFIVVAAWRGGRVVREAKALVASGWDWAHGQTGHRHRFMEAASASTRAPDPFLAIEGNFILRRVAADTRKVERTAAFDRKLDLSLLGAMGFELGTFHASSATATAAILSDLQVRPAGWLSARAKAVTSVVEADFEAWGQR